MRTSTIVWIVIILIIILGGGWYYYSTHTLAPARTSPDTAQSQGSTGSTDTGALQQPGADGAEGTVIGGNVALGVDKSPTFGAYLIAYNGMTVYTFAKDKTGTSTCYSKCADNWPPYTVGAEDNVQNVKLGVTGDKVGTITRADGTIQVTYNGLPLYFFAGDKASGDTAGENVGKVWFVVKP